MSKTNRPVTEIIEQRFSCRDYNPDPISSEKQEQLTAFINDLAPGPFGNLPRFDLLAATETDSKALRGLGTYGFIKNPSAFIPGAMKSSAYDLEDIGYLMEVIVLYATSLDLGTCWLGGTFTKSRFAKKINLTANETIPAVLALGEFAAPNQKRKGTASRTAGSFRRIPWDELFFNMEVDVPLSLEDAGDHAKMLEMVRIGPSASNKQPWRIVKHNNFWRFFMRRTPGYRRDFIKSVLDLCDLQRMDMGIAMSHFELTAKELGLKGKWGVEVDLDKLPDEMTEYIVSWETKGR
jgi:nitroreductase